MAFSRGQRVPGDALADIIRTKPRATDGGLSVRATVGHQGPARCAVIVPKATAPGAARRGSLRRRYTETLRGILRERRASDGIWCVVLVRDGHDVPAQERARRVLALLEKSGIVSR